MELAPPFVLLDYKFYIFCSSKVKGEIGSSFCVRNFIFSVVQRLKVKLAPPFVLEILYFL